MKKHALLHRALAVVGSVSLLLTVILSLGIFSATAQTEPTNLVLEKLPANTYFITHKLNWSDPHPDYTGEAMTAKGVPDGIGAWMNGALDDPAYFFGDTNNGTYGGNRRAAILYDLGGGYDLSEVTIHVPNFSLWAVYNFSVYAGNVADSSLLNIENRVGTGGSATAQATAFLSNAVNVRYVLIVFDHVGADPGNANDSSIDPSTGERWGGGTNLPGWAWTDAEVRISEIEVYGAPTTVVPDTNILYNKKSGSLYTISHALDWNVAYPDYTNNTVNNAPADYLNDTDLTRLTDGIVDNKDLMAVIADTWNTGDGKDRRLALMYDLGGQYDLSKVTLHSPVAVGDPHEWPVYNYSVYAGNTSDASILSDMSNRVATAGGATIEESATLTGVTNVRYVMIVFDHVGSDPGNADDTSSGYTSTTTLPGYGGAFGDIRLSEIEVFGSASNAVSSSNVIQGSTSVKAYAVAHQLNWSEEHPNYTGKALNERQLPEASQIALTDNTTASGKWFFEESMASVKPGEAAARRMVLVYDLGDYYDLTKTTIYSAGDRFAVYDFSVYAANVLDSSILNIDNRVGTGGGAAKEESATLAGAEGVRYVAIVFDHVGTDPGNANDKDDSGNYRLDPATGERWGGGTDLPGWDGANGGVFLYEVAVLGTPLLKIADESKGFVTIEDITDGVVTVTAKSEGMDLATKGLVCTIGDKTYPILERKDAFIDNVFNKAGESNTTTYQFKLPETNQLAVISASFVAEGSANVGIIARSIHSTAYKMRFLSRVYREYNDGATTYELKECGTLMVKKNGTPTDITYRIRDGFALPQADMLTLYNGLKSNDGTVTGSLKPTTTLYDRCDDYLEYVLAINFGSAQSPYMDTAYCAFAYAVYTDGTNDVVLFSAAAVDTYTNLSAVVAAQ